MMFKDSLTHEEREIESQKIMGKYPERLPVIVERAKGCQLTQIRKNKFLVCKDMTMSQFVFMIRKRIELDPSQSLFILVNNQIASSNITMNQVYQDHKDDDGFIYMVYTSENTFG